VFKLRVKYRNSGRTTAGPVNRVEYKHSRSPRACVVLQVEYTDFGGPRGGLVIQVEYPRTWPVFQVEYLSFSADPVIHYLSGVVDQRYH
jgi:hypothetical protein